VRGSQGAILASSVAWMDTFFDSAANLIRYPGNTGRHAVRESLWYAAGLLVQRRDAAAPRALRAIDAVLSLQFDRPCAVWDGTWPRAPQETLVRPDGAEAYVSCDASRQIAVIDTKEWKVKKLIDAGPGADGLAWAKGK